jgi:hypothetical protein
MSILTLNLAFSTLVFGIAARHRLGSGKATELRIV